MSSRFQRPARCLRRGEGPQSPELLAAKHGGDEPGSARIPAGRKATEHPCGLDPISRTGLICTKVSNPAPPSLSKNNCSATCQLLQPGFSMQYTTGVHVSLLWSAEAATSTPSPVLRRRSWHGALPLSLLRGSADFFKYHLFKLVVRWTWSFFTAGVSTHSDFKGFRTAVKGRSPFAFLCLYFPLQIYVEVLQVHHPPPILSTRCT